MFRPGMAKYIKWNYKFFRYYGNSRTESLIKSIRLNLFNAKEYINPNKGRP